MDKIRILMGDEVSKRTKKALLAGLENIKRKLDLSIEREKEQNDFLSGVPGIVDALRAGKIICRVYNKDKFHAKAYIIGGSNPSLSVILLSNFFHLWQIEEIKGLMSFASRASCASFASGKA